MFETKYHVTKCVSCGCEIPGYGGSICGDGERRCYHCASDFLRERNRLSEIEERISKLEKNK